MEPEFELGRTTSSSWDISAVLYSQLYSSILEKDSLRMRYVSCSITKKLLCLED
ncbi:MAG: hypothetical protein ACTSVZ_07505 [Promethearchaeota archaeon]